MYEVGLALPALFYAMVNVVEPWRTRLIVGAYLLAALWMPIDALIWFNPLAIITLGGTILCGVSLYARESVPIRTVSRVTNHAATSAMNERSKPYLVLGDFDFRSNSIGFLRFFFAAVVFGPLISLAASAMSRSDA